MTCKVCQGNSLQFLYRFCDGPAMQQKLYDTREGALAEKSAPVTLYGCKDCGFVFNESFAEEETEYSSDYDNTQNYSECFNAYTAKQAKRLVWEYDLQNKKVVEVGCGKGHFLKLLYEEGVRDIRGFDPAYTDNDPLIDGLVRKEFFDTGSMGEKADFIICRNVLEHVKSPLKFVEALSGGLLEGGVMYFELPALDWILENESFFDFYYEHCNYFSQSSLTKLFAAVGFQNMHFSRGVDGQYFQVTLKRGKKKSPIAPPDIASIPVFLDKKIGEYNKLVRGLESFALWGAGAKGVTFLTRLGIGGGKCRYVIDINPNKHNKFIPLCGQKIVSPSILSRSGIKTIVIVNPVYEREVKAKAAEYNFKGHYITVR